MTSILENTGVLEETPAKVSAKISSTEGKEELWKGLFPKGATQEEKKKAEEATIKANTEIATGFAEKLAELRSDYKKALANDLTESTGAGEKGFAWGEHVPLDKGQMFNQAIGYALKIVEHTQEKELGKRTGPVVESDIRGYENKLRTDFGPNGTKSGEVIDEIIRTVKGTYDKFKEVNGTPQAGRIRRAFDLFNSTAPSEKH